VFRLPLLIEFENTDEEDAFGMTFMREVMYVYFLCVGVLMYVYIYVCVYVKEGDEISLKFTHHTKVN
jgi:hypothetical protein